MNELEPIKLNQKEEKIKDIIQAQIYSCLNCQARDSGEWIWVIGEQINISELFGEHDLTDKEISNISDNLYCPNCGSDNIEPYSEIGVKPYYEIVSEKIIKNSDEKFSKEIFELQEHVTNFPFLIYQNKIAQQIYNELSTSKFPITSVSGILYRVREVKSSEIILPDKMKNPPMGKSQAGRFNHPGQSHYYLSKNKETAIKEVVVDKNAALVWVQKYSLIQPVEKILDLSYSINTVSPTTSTLYIALKLYNTFNWNNRNKENWKPDYYLTRYIMDCSKKLGYSGILYNSSKISYDKNLVLFYPDKIEIQEIGNPEIEKFELKESDEWPF